MTETFVNVKTIGAGSVWRVQTGRKGKGEVVSNHYTKKAAVKRAKQYARNSKRRPSTVLIRRSDGTMQDSVSYK